MNTIIKIISFETVMVYIIIAILAIILAFFIMKKKNPNDCSRVILLSLIPLFLSIAFETYCFQKNIGSFLEKISGILFFLCLVAVFITSATVAFISYKQKGVYFETLKERKPIFVLCGIFLVIAIVMILCAKCFL